MLNTKLDSISNPLITLWFVPRARAELAGQITWYRSALAAVQQAMAYGAVQGQGQWPQQPPH